MRILITLLLRHSVNINYSSLLNTHSRYVKVYILHTMCEHLLRIIIYIYVYIYRCRTNNIIPKCQHHYLERWRQNRGNKDVGLLYQTTFGLTREFHYLSPVNINSFCQIYAKGTRKMRVDWSRSRIIRMQTILYTCLYFRIGELMD